MELLQAIGTALVVLIAVCVPLAIWIYALGHAAGHGRRGLAFLMVFMPGVAVLYALLHRHPRTPPAPNV